MNRKLSTTCSHLSGGQRCKGSHMLENGLCESHNTCSRRLVEKSCAIRQTLGCSLFGFHTFFSIVQHCNRSVLEVNLTLRPISVKSKISGRHQGDVRNQETLNSSRCASKKSCMMSEGCLLSINSIVFCLMLSRKVKIFTIFGNGHNFFVHEN